MAHECPYCGQACYCDGDDTWMDAVYTKCDCPCDEDEDDDMSDDPEVHVIPRRENP
jgi:hypothetical protein